MKEYKRTVYSRICPTCRKAFDTISSGRVYCSDECKKRRKTKVNITVGIKETQKSEANRKKQMKESFRKVDEFIYKYHKENGRWLSYGKAVEMMEKAGA